MKLKRRTHRASGTSSWSAKFVGWVRHSLRRQPLLRGRYTFVVLKVHLVTPSSTISKEWADAGVEDILIRTRELRHIHDRCRGAGSRNEPTTGGYAMSRIVGRSECALADAGIRSVPALATPEHPSTLQRRCSTVAGSHGNSKANRSSSRSCGLRSGRCTEKASPLIAI